MSEESLWFSLSVSRQPHTAQGSLWRTNQGAVNPQAGGGPAEGVQTDIGEREKTPLP